MGAFSKVTAVPPAPLLWVDLEVAVGRIPVLVDTGSQFSCLRTHVVEYLHMRSQPSKFSECTLPYMLADGTRTKISDLVTLHVRLLNFSWDHEFKILKEGPFQGIVGMDFLSKTQMIGELPSMTYRFAFAPNVRGAFLDGELPTSSDAFLQ